MMNETIKVLVVDDSALTRHGVRSVLAPHAGRHGILVVGEAAHADGAVAECERLQPDVVLLDARLPGRSGVEVCRELLSAPRAPRVIMLTAFADDDLVYDSFLAGAHGYLLKEIDPVDLAAAIVAAAAGRPVVSTDVNSAIVRVLRERSAAPFEDRVAQLSPQEKRVLEAVAEGLGTKEAAVRLGLSPFTVRNYLVNVFEKLEVRNRAQAVALYVRSRRGRS
ncbi:MAG: response regulator transcription factor [Opitutaceae bacterium]|nr:response regulator transcription factor [Opitutaceae bacterium]